MAKALSVDLRHRVVAAIAEGMSRRQAAARFGGERGERGAMASTVQGEWHGCAEQAGRGSPLRSDRGL